MTKCVGLWWQLLVFSFVKTQCLLVVGIPGEGIYDHWVPSGGSVFRQVNGSSKSLPTFVGFQVCPAQSNQYTKVAYLGLAYSTTLHYSLLLIITIIPATDVCLLGSYYL